MVTENFRYAHVVSIEEVIVKFILLGEQALSLQRESNRLQTCYGQ